MILCIINVIGLYHNVCMCKTSPHLVDFQMQERRQKVTTETLLDLVWTLLKNTTFKFNKTTWKKLRGTTIAPKFFRHMQFHSWLILTKDFWKTLKYIHTYAAVIIIIYIVILEQWNYPKFLKEKLAFSVSISD